MHLAGLSAELKAKAAQWEDETPGGISSLPERVPGSGHTRYRLSIDRKDSLPNRGIPMASKFVGKGTMPKVVHFQLRSDPLAR